MLIDPMNLPENNPLMDQKPIVDAACDAVIAENGYNAIIDTLASELKMCLDFNAFLPWYWCNELDSMVMMISMMNSNTLPVTNVAIESLLN